MILKKIGWISGHPAKPKMRIVPEGIIIVAIVECKSPEKIMV